MYKLCKNEDVYMHKDYLDIWKESEREVRYSDSRSIEMERRSIAFSLILLSTREREREYDNYTRRNWI